MIKVLRVDDRLLHGQVAVAWVNFYKADVILIANDQVITDQTMQMAFKLATPPGGYAFYEVSGRSGCSDQQSQACVPQHHGCSQDHAGCGICMRKNKRGHKECASWRSAKRRRKTAD